LSQCAVIYGLTKRSAGRIGRHRLLLLLLLLLGLSISSSPAAGDSLLYYE